MDKETEMMSVTQAARELEVTINTIYARINDGTLPAVFNPAVKSRRYSVKREDVERLKRTKYLPVERLAQTRPAKAGSGGADKSG